MATLTKTSKEIQWAYTTYYDGYDFGDKTYEYSHIYIEIKSKKYMLIGIKEVSDKLEFTYAYKEDVIVITYEISDKIKFDITDKITPEYYDVIEKHYGVPPEITHQIRLINTHDSAMYDNDIMYIADKIKPLSNDAKSYIFGWIDHIGHKSKMFISYLALQQIFYRFCLESEMDPVNIKIIPNYIWLIHLNEIERYIEEEMIHFINPYGVLVDKCGILGNCLLYLSEVSQYTFTEMMISDMQDYVDSGVIPEEVAIDCVDNFKEEMRGMGMEEIESGVTIH